MPLSFFHNNQTVKQATQTTSHEITRKTNPKDQGLCLPLTNMYTEFQMGGGSHECIEGNSQAIYERAISYRKKHENLRAPGRDYANPAFSANENVSYSNRIVPASNVKSSDALQESTIGRGPHSIITFKAKTPSKETAYHQVGIGKDKQGQEKCYFFDSNMRGFETVGSCENIRNLAATMIACQMAPEATDVLVASDEYSPTTRAMP